MFKLEKHAFTETPWLLPLGIFVWGDALVIIPFWILAGLITLLMHDWWYLGLLTSLFWLVRGWGEATYWLNQQFSSKNRNPPEKMRFYNFVKSEAIWFVYQVFWQMVMVLSLTAMIILVLLRTSQ